MNRSDGPRGQHNSAFVGDDGHRGFSTINEKEKTGNSSSYVLELTDNQKNVKEQDYEPYSQRKVEYPTT